MVGYPALSDETWTEDVALVIFWVATVGLQVADPSDALIETSACAYARDFHF